MPQTRARTAFFLLGSFFFLVAAQSPQKPPASVTEDGVTVHFSPNGGCTEAIVQNLGAAKKSIDVQCYSFTSTTIAKALENAHKRGVKVRVVMDSSNETDRYSGATYLANAGIPVSIDGEHAIAHNKVMIIDGPDHHRVIQLHSRRGREEAENLLIIENKPKLADAYNRNLAAHLAHSLPYRSTDK